MNKSLLFLSLLAFLMNIGQTVFAQDDIWKTLSRITYKKQYDEMVGFDVSVPVFSDPVKALEGKEITVRGYIIPVEGYESQTNFIFSAFPYNMCFFCGGAGPETVMEVYAKKGIEFTAKAIKIKGVLRLNDKDINQLMYALEDAVLVE